MGYMDEFNKELRKLTAQQRTSGGSSGVKLTGGTKRKQNETSKFMEEFYNELDKYNYTDIAPVSTSISNRMTVAPIAPKEEERTWFDSGAFRDGYQFGDVTKVILGTGSDILENVGTGILGIGEKIVDAGAYIAPYITKGHSYQIMYESGRYGDVEKEVNKNFEESKKEMAEFIPKDLYDEEAVAKFLISTPIEFFTGASAERDSVLGEKSDALVQSAGQLAGRYGLSMVGVPWWVTSFTTSFGSEAENALRQGATYEEAGLSAGISAASEVLSEKLFGGDVFTSKAGISLSDKFLATAISNKTLRILAKLGFDTAGEGIEEVVSQVGSRIGADLYKKEGLKEAIFSEEAFDEYLESLIGGVVLGGGMGAIKVRSSGKKGVDYASGLNVNEQKVVEKVYNDRLAEAEKEGTVSQKEKGNIYDQVVLEMQNGQLSIADIESTLGGETYQNWKQVSEWEDSLQSEYDELHKAIESGDVTGEQLAREAQLETQLRNIKATSGREGLRLQLGEEVFGLAKGTRLMETYNEQGKRGQAYEADITKYDAKQQGVIQKAIDSGILNNTRRTHEFVDMIARISADKGVAFDFTNNEKLKNSSFAVDGKTVNGFVTKDGITLNIQSSKALNSVVGHEITHVLEGTELYNEMQKAVFAYAESKGELTARWKAIKEMYANVKDANVNAELTADLVGDYLFTDSDFISRLSTEHRTTFEKIYDEIKYLYNVATAGSKEARQLEKVKKAFEEAYRATGKGTTATKFSLSGDGDFGLSNLTIDDVLKMSDEEFTQLYGELELDDYIELDDDFDSDSISEEADVEPEVVKVIFRRSGLGDSHVESNRMAVMTQKRIDQRIEEHGAGNTSYARRYITRISPKDFIDLTVYSENVDRAKFDSRVRGDFDGKMGDWDYEKQLRDSKEPPVLIVNQATGQIIGHNGRHRVRALEMAGIESVEIEIELHDEDGYLIKYNAETIPDMAISSQFDTAIETHVSNVIPLNNAHRGEIGQYYGEKAHADSAVKYSISDSAGNQLTAEQQEFFADSKVRDENGRLLPVYHGSKNSGFNVFQYSKDVQTGTDYGEAYYFTSDRQKASGYSYDVTKDERVAQYEKDREALKNRFLETRSKADADAFLNYRYEGKKLNELIDDEAYLTEGGEVKEVYLNLKNPLIADAGGKYYYEVYPELFANARKNGNDGIIVKNVIDNPRGEARPIDTYIAFSPEQIKNTNNLNPTSDPDIRYSVSEVTDAQNEMGLDTKSEVQFSLSNDTAYMDKAIATNNSMMRVDSKVMSDVKALRERIAKRMNDIKDRGLVGLPEDIEGNTYIANSSYDGTEENTTICPRSLASEAFVDAVSEYLGRPLTVEEQIYISQDLQGRSLTPECTYCYVATDRKAYRAFLGEYISQRDAVLQKIADDPTADVSRSGELYKEFLNGRKDTNPMYSRFKMWVDAQKNGKPMIDASHLANINKLMGDINSEFGAELKPQIVDAMKYAQSASWAKKRVNYVAYNGHILKWKQDRINKLNSHYGLRMYSFSDFHPAFVLENMQMITDASVRGLKMLGYTKDTDFVEIFAPSGMNINVSTFGFEAGGEVFENNLIGAEWEKAKNLREQYPNVGVTFVATNDTLVDWALNQDWIDVVIPFHLVRTGREVAKAFNYHDYTSESSDMKTKEWSKSDKKYIAPTEHNNDKATYLAALEKNHLKPRFERFLENPNYMKLVNECRQPASQSKPVQPVFNEDAAMVALAKLEANGYYQPIGGSVDRMYEIAGEVAEAMTQQIAPDSQYSLSNVGEAHPTYGNYNVYGDDVALAPVKETVSEPVAENVQTVPEEPAMFPDDKDTPYTELENLQTKRDGLEAQMLAMANAGDFSNAVDFSNFEKVNDEYIAVQERIHALETELYEADSNRIGSLSDSDVPPVMEAPYGEETRKGTRLPRNEISYIAQELQTILPVEEDQIADVREVIDMYASGQIQTREELIYEVQSRFGEYAEYEYDDDLADVKKDIRTRGINVSDTIKRGIPDYHKFMRSNFGKLRFSKNGTDVDELYQELQKDYPHYFPKDIDVPEDQLLHMAELVSRKPDISRMIPVDTETIEAAADVIIGAVSDYSLAQQERFANKDARSNFQSLVKQGDKYAPPIKDVAPVKPLAKATPDTFDAPIFESTEKNAVKGQTTLFEPPKPNPKVANVLTEESAVAKEKSGIGMKVVSEVVDKGMVFENLSLKTGNHELQAKWNYALPSNTEARAQYFMEHGDNGVKALKDIKETVDKSGKADDFYNYLYHVHNIDRMTLEERFGVENKTVFGETVTADVSRQKAAQYERVNPEFKSWANDVYAYNRHLRKMLVDGKVISKETAALWEKMYPHYVPIRRVDSNGQNISVPLDTNKTGVNNPVKRATGGSSDIQPVFSTMAQRTEQTYRAIARNAFGIELKNTLGTTINSQKNTTGVDEAVDTLVAQEDHLLKAGTMSSNPTFTVFENGERVEFEITEDMFDALKPAGKLLGYRNRAISKVSGWRRNLLTSWNPVFALYRNPVKDLQDVAINSQHAVRTYLNIPYAAIQLASNTKVAKAIFGSGVTGKYVTEYHQNGGKSNTYFDSRKNEFKPEDNFFKRTIGMPVRAIEAAGEFIEEIPRLAEYIASRQGGRSVERSMLDAARVTTNFAAGGDFTKFFNSHGFTFLNASIQGASQHVRNFREAKQQGLKGYVKVLAKYTIAGLPGILLNNLLWDDDEEYEELSDYVKQNYYVIAKTEDGKFVRIPKGRTAAVMQNLMEQMNHLVTGDDEADFGTFFELFMNNIAPNNPIENNILAPIGQAWTNEAWYGGDLVPSRLQSLPAEEQFDESTDSISKWLGEKTGFSPYKINYLLDQYSGGLGDVFLPMLTPEAESGDNSFMGNMLAPWKKEMTTDSVLNNKNPGDFYDLKDELEIMSNSKNATEEDKMRSMYMDSVSWEMGDLYAQKREIQSGSLPDDKKYEAVRQIQEEINELAKTAMGGYNNVRIRGNYSTVGNKRYNRDAETGNWYEIKPKNSDGTANYYYQKEQEVTKGLGITPEQYWNNREEYNYAFDKPDQYAVAQAVGGYSAYRRYSGELYDIKADKDENGKSISGSRKKKVISYINGLDADYGSRIILYKSEYPSDDTYNNEIIEYLNSRNDISYKEMEAILKYLGFNVDANGNITW